MQRVGDLLLLFAAVRSLDEESINRPGWGQRERSFLLGSATLVNRFQTNADRDATNYNGVGLIDRTAAELEIVGSLRLAFVYFSATTFLFFSTLSYLNRIFLGKEEEEVSMTACGNNVRRYSAVKRRACGNILRHARAPSRRRSQDLYEILRATEHVPSHSLLQPKFLPTRETFFSYNLPCLLQKQRFRREADARSKGN